MKTRKCWEEGKGNNLMPTDRDETHAEEETEKGGKEEGRPGRNELGTSGKKAQRKKHVCGRIEVPWDRLRPLYKHHRASIENELYEVRYGEVREGFQKTTESDNRDGRDFCRL